MALIVNVVASLGFVEITEYTKTPEHTNQVWGITENSDCKLSVECVTMKSPFKGSHSKQQYIGLINKNDTGYPQDGRADKDSYPHDGRADKDSYLHDRHNQYIMLSL